MLGGTRRSFREGVGAWQLSCLGSLLVGRVRWTWIVLRSRIGAFADAGPRRGYRCNDRCWFALRQKRTFRSLATNE